MKADLREWIFLIDITRALPKSTVVAAVKFVPAELKRLLIINHLVPGFLALW